MCMAMTLFMVCLWAGGSLEGTRRFVIRRIRIIGQSSVWTEGWTLIDSGSLDTWKRAEAYYKAQKPLIRESARNHSVHAYFASVGKHVKSENIGWYEMIGFRAKEMARMLEQEGRDDFRLEKDKCTMMDFFQRNNFPMPSVIKVWKVRENFKSELEQPETLLANAKFPVFLKCCHLTQGSSKSTIPLKSVEYVKQNWTWLKRWIDSKWKYVADDWERPWAKDGNKLTDTLKPGFLLQQPFPIPNGSGMQFMELKVEVIFGRAYLAVANEPYKGTMVLRDNTVEAFPTLWAQTTNSAIVNPEITKWVQDEGHLPKVWALAEKAAKIMAVDEVRIDIFIRRGDPDGLMINENSLSSGMGYRMHFNFMAKLWAEGHLHNWYKTYDNNVPVYMQTERDIPGPETAAVAAKTAARSTSVEV